MASALDDLDNPLSAIIAMYNLEDQSGGTEDLEQLGTNHVVARQNDNLADPASDGFHQAIIDAARPAGFPPSQHTPDKFDQSDYCLQVSDA